MTNPAPTPEKENAQGAVVPPAEAPKPKADAQAPATPPAPTPQPSAEEQAKVRVEEALRKVESTNERIRKAVELNAELVSETPELIHKVFKTDPDLANQVVEKIWGNEGVKSYKQLLERARLEQVKAEDPKQYETAKAVAELKAKLEEKESKERNSAMAQFLTAKGIIQNEYDPKYKKLLEALEVIDPKFRENNFPEALDTAFRIAFSDVHPVMKGGAPAYSAGRGTPPPPLPDSRPPVSDQSLWLADQLNKKFGHKIDLNS